MSQTQSSYAVMFIDFVGSTKLYELLGDVQANSVIDDVISSAASQVDTHKGVVIKTIGDELMCRFDCSDDAFNAACMIQETVDELPVTKGFKIVSTILCLITWIPRSSRGMTSFDPPVPKVFGGVQDLSRRLGFRSLHRDFGE